MAKAEISLPEGFALTTFTGSAIFGKNHEKAGQPRKSSTGKDAVFLQVGLVGPDGREYVLNSNAVARA